jgi:transposase
MWTPENRPLYDRDKLRYPSDLTDAEWQHIGPLLPPAKRGGGKRTVDMREVVKGVMYVLSTGCQWRYIPKDLPPRSTVYDYFSRWVGLRWHVGENPLHALRQMPRAGRSRGQSHCLHRR